jgi:hypothetical protein
MRSAFKLIRIAEQIIGVASETDGNAGYAGTFSMQTD